MQERLDECYGDGDDTECWWVPEVADVAGMPAVAEVAQAALQSSPLPDHLVSQPVRSGWRSGADQPIAQLDLSRRRGRGILS